MAIKPDLVRNVMKITATYKDGVLIPDRPITPRSEVLHVEIPDGEIVLPSETDGENGGSEALAEEREKIRKLMEEEPFLRELWKDLEDGLPPDPEEAESGESVNQRDRRLAFEFRSQSRQEDGRPL
jgi:hypothetical protein